jgi:hypothetical protein
VDDLRNSPPVFPASASVARRGSRCGSYGRR